MTRFLSLLSVVCGGFGSAALAADDFQSHEQIREVARTYLLAYLQQNGATPTAVEVGKLDARLRLKPCESDLQAFLPRGSRTIGNTTVGIRCTGSRPWSLHVPMKVRLEKTIAVAAHPLTRGHVIQAGDILMKRVDVSQLPQGYIEQRTRLLGHRVKRQIGQGATFTPRMIEKPLKVRRGQRVSILARSGAMEVRMAGKALASGAVGDRIRVENLKSKQKREGVIDRNGDVVIEL